MRILRVSVGWSVCLLGAAVAPAFAQTSGSVKSIAYARVDAAKRLAADELIVAQVAAKNDLKESKAEVERKDREWMALPNYPLKSALTTGACADRLRSAIKDDALIVEAILMDAQGANVCASSVTSDYWQGDEAKWRMTFVNGNQFFVDEPAFDPSAGVFALQLSVPVSRAGERIGALTLTMRVKRELVRGAGR